MRIFWIFLILLTFSYSKTSISSDSCLKNAITQTDMNTCANLSVETAEKELNRVYEEIKKLYSDQTNFLLVLQNSQQAWIKLRDLNLELYYPATDKRWQYGSVYPMCVSEKKTKITLQRIEFLKQWLKGCEEGEVCAGSIKPIELLSN